MIGFWLSALIMLAVGILFVVLPLVVVPRSQQQQKQRDELNKAIYNDRLQELQREEQEGIVENRADLEQDLKRTLLDDVPVKAALEQNIERTPKIMFISVVVLVLVSVGFYQGYGGYLQVQHWQQVSHNLPQLMHHMVGQNSPTLTEQQLRDLNLALRTHLYHSPEDHENWQMLSKVAMSQRDMETAKQAMARAYQLDSSNEELQLNYAQILMLSHDQTERNFAVSLLENLVKQPVAHLRAVSLLAFHAYENGDYPKAIHYWTRMQQMIGKQDSRYKMLERSISRAKANMQQ